MHKGAVRRYVSTQSAAWLLSAAAYRSRGSNLVMWHTVIGNLSWRTNVACAIRAWLHHDIGQCLSFDATTSGVDDGGTHCL
jgi:hypothetical protein